MARVLLSNISFLSLRNVFTDYGVAGAVNLVRELHLDGIELLPSRHHDEQYIGRLLNGVPIVGIHLPWTWQWWRQARLAILKGALTVLSQFPWRPALELGRHLRAEHFVVHPEAFVNLNVPWDTLTKIEGLCFENDWLEDGYKGTHAAYIFAYCCGPSAGVVLDTCHLGRVSVDANNPLEAYRRVKDRLRVVNLSDYSPTLGEHLIPGHGELGWLPDFLGWLKEDKFSGPIVLEVRQSAVEPRYAIEHSLRYLQRYGF